MESVLEMDRRQVFGAELDMYYLDHIKNVFEQKIRELTMKKKDNSVTLPLTRWA